MEYLAVWKVLEQMVIDFKKKGVSVPPNIINDLRNVKTTISILKTDPSGGSHIEKIEVLLGNIESYLMSEGQKRFGEFYVNAWLERRDKASRETIDEGRDETSFVSGVPRHQKWVRLRPSNELSLEKLKTLAQESDLSCSVQTNGTLLVFGPDKVLKDFVKKIASKYRSKLAKERGKVRNC